METDSSIFSLAIVRRRSSSNTSHHSNIQHDILLKKINKTQESSTLEQAGSIESYHIELHGCAVSGFLGTLAVASRE